MDTIWLDAPWPALLLAPQAGPRVARLNVAAEAWAARQGLTAAALRGWAEALDDEALQMSSEQPLGSLRLRCVPVAHAQGRLLWLQLLAEDGTGQRMVHVQRACRLLGQALVLAGVSVWRIDLNTRRIHFNVRGFEIAGMAHESEGVDLDAMRATVHPDDRQALQQGADEALASDRVVDVVARYRNADGSWRSLLTRRVAERDEQGRAIGITGISLDLSDQVAERERAEVLAERARLVAEVLGIGFWSRDEDAGTGYWDEGMFRLYGLDPAGRPPALVDWLQSCVHVQDRERMARQALLSTPAQDRTDALVETLFRIEGPVERWVQSWTRRVLRGGRRVSYGMHLEVTARQRAEQRAQRERQRTQVAIDAAGLGVWERDAEGRVVHWNEAMYHLRGLSADDPRTPAEIMADCTHPEDHLHFLELRQMHVEQGVPYQHEFRVRQPDGQWRWLATVGRALRDETGQVVGMAGVNVDVTERRAAEELQREKQRLEQASRDKSAFMARMSHELRTPMNAVLGFTRLLLEDVQQQPTARQRERLQHIDDAGSRLMQLIDDLLQIAQRDSPAEVVPAAQGLRVLCVEDNEMNLQLVRELLAMRPAVQLRTAETGQEGLAAATAEPPDLLLLDLNLPDVSGVEVMRQLRRLAALDGCRIVALSADAMPDHIAAALAAGFDDYWTKPIQFDAFLAGIDRLAAQRAQAVLGTASAPGAVA